MPDHVHLVVEGTTREADLRRFVSRSKHASGCAFACRTGERFWQQGFYDHVVRSEADLRKAVVYCLANPIRAGLVTMMEAWPSWGSDVYSRDELATFVAERARHQPRPATAGRADEKKKGPAPEGPAPGRRDGREGART